MFVDTLDLSICSNCCNCTNPYGIEYFITLDDVYQWSRRTTQAWRYKSYLQLIALLNSLLFLKFRRE
mgnify:FL=1